MQTSHSEETLRELRERKEQAFKQFYNHTIYPELVRLERLRRQILAAGLVALMLLPGVVVIFRMGQSWSVGVLLMLPALFFGGWAGKNYKNYHDEFKLRIVSLILDFWDDYVNYQDLRYTVEGLITQSLFERSGLFKLRDGAIYESEDSITGLVGSVPFTFSEVRVSQPSLVSNSIYELFHGICLFATLGHERHLREKEKIAEGEEASETGKFIFIIPREQHEFFWRSIQAAIRNGAKEMTRWIHYKPFREHFLVYATNEVYLRKMVPEELQRLLMNYYLETKREWYLSVRQMSYKKSGVREDHAWLAVRRGKDLLEPSIWYSVLRFDLIKGFYEDILSVMEILEAFDEVH